MQRVDYERPADIPAALRGGATAGAAYYAGGTTLLDLMKLDIETPQTLVDINHLPLGGIEMRDGTLRFGALTRMSDAADHPDVGTHAPAIAAALLVSASAQLRNMATLGGNLLQRTRCAYFRDRATPCNKRTPRSGCGALAGVNAEHAVLGTSEHCIAVHASDFAVPLAAFDAIVHVTHPRGTRTLGIGEMLLVPGETPERETTLGHGELIDAIAVPLSAALRNSTYVKVRDRSSYAFALASCAAGVERAADGTIADVRIALGGVGTVPWRAHESEARLRGERPDRALFAEAARIAFAQARPTTQNAYKIDLGQRAMVRALETVTA